MNAAQFDAKLPHSKYLLMAACVLEGLFPPMRVSYTLAFATAGRIKDSGETIPLPRGTVVEGPSAFPNVGIVEVSYQGRTVQMFADDLAAASTKTREDG